MNKNAFYGLLLVILLPLTGYLIVRGYSKEALAMPRHYIYDTVISKTEKGKLINDTVWHRIPDFKLQNQMGKTVGWENIGDKIVVADFFFTRCPTICPRMTTNMKRLQTGITSGKRGGSKEANFVQYLSFSVDPERDSVAELKKWADRFQINPSNWWLLTGPKKEIYDLSIEHMKLGLVDGKGIDTGFFHTDFIVLIDKNRNIRGYYHGLDTASLQQLSRDMVLLSLEKDPKRKKFFEGKLELLAFVFFFTLIAIGLLLYFFKKEKKINDTHAPQE